MDTGHDVPTPASPGACNPFVPSLLTSTLDVPAFTGCRGSHGEDLDPLLTGLISGRHDRLDVTQLLGLTPFGCLTGYVDGGTVVHPPVVDPGSVAVRPG